MSFLYPRTITVRRATTEKDFGAQGYSGLDPTQETEVVKNVPASIQQTTATGASDAKLPSDAFTRTGWRVFVRLSDRTLIKERDIIVDDTKKRYLVTSGYWNSLGYNCYVELLET
jgi:hypothetical protein